MMPRVEYEMTKEDLATLLSACKSTPCMMIGSYVPPSPQENANNAWALLGQKMGFDSMTVRPIEGKGNQFFTAVPSETASQRDERIAREQDDKRREAIHTLKMEIADRQGRLLALAKTAAEKEANDTV